MVIVKIEARSWVKVRAIQKEQELADHDHRETDPGNAIVTVEGGPQPSQWPEWEARFQWGYGCIVAM